MTPTEFDRFLQELVPEYANQNVAAGYWERSNALERARAETTQLLPKGRETPDHYFFTLKVDPAGTSVGSLWFAVRHPPAAPGGFVYDIVVDKAHRRHGFAAAALRELETFAKGLGVDRISLHVFGSNAGAIELYRRLGYTPASLLMSKPIPK